MQREVMQETNHKNKRDKSEGLLPVKIVSNVCTIQAEARGGGWRIVLTVTSDLHFVNKHPNQGLSEDFGDLNVK